MGWLCVLRVKASQNDRRCLLSRNLARSLSLTGLGVNTTYDSRRLRFSALYSSWSRKSSVISAGEARMRQPDGQSGFRSVYSNWVSVWKGSFSALGLGNRDRRPDSPLREAVPLPARAGKRIFRLKAVKGMTRLRPDYASFPNRNLAGRRICPGVFGWTLAPRWQIALADD